MEPFVQMPLGTYDTLKFNNEYLKRKLKEEQESHNEDVAQAKKEINDLAEKIDQYKKYLLELNCGLKEYKKHQERASERRYRSGEESWHRGSVVAKKK